MMMMSRPGMRTIAGVAFFAAAIGCGGEQRDGGVAGGGGDPEEGGTVVIAQNADMAQPLATLSQGGLDGFLQDVLYMNLLHGEWRDGRLAYVTAEESPMALARSYEYVGEDSASLVSSVATRLRSVRRLLARASCSSVSCSSARDAFSKSRSESLNAGSDDGEICSDVDMHSLTALPHGRQSSERIKGAAGSHRPGGPRFLKVRRLQASIRGRRSWAREPPSKRAPT